MRRLSVICRLQKLQNVLERVAAGISSTTIFVTMLLVTVDVVMRYVFNSPIPGVYNIVELLMIGIVFLAVATVQTHREHVKVELFTSWLTQRTQTALDIFGSIAGLFIFSIMTWQGARLAWRSWVEQDYSMGIVHVPYWPGKWTFTIGLGLLCLRLLTHILTDSLSLIRPSQPSHPEVGK
jgi:TRAP-type C4-dicarboxylate transport system permease small subunit